MMDDEGDARLKATYGDNYARRAARKKNTTRPICSGSTKTSPQGEQPGGTSRGTPFANGVDKDFVIAIAMLRDPGRASVMRADSN